MRKLGIVVALIALLSLPTLTRAEESYLKTRATAPGMIKPVNAEREDKLREIKAKLETERKEREASKQERREQGPETFSNRLNRHLEQVTKHTDQVLGKLEALNRRIEAHLATLAAGGTDVTGWQARRVKLAEDIAKARSALANLPTKLSEISKAETATPTQAKLVREAVMEVTVLVKNASQDSRALVQEIRAATPRPANTLKPSTPETSAKQ